MRLDGLARKVTLLRAGNRCEKCGKGERLQCHHVYSRSLLMLRHDVENLLCLCSGCHLWWHHNPLESAAWFEARFGAERRARLLLIRQTRRKTDLNAVVLALEVIARQYENA